jgi:hypothetical protein
MSSRLIVSALLTVHNQTLYLSLVIMTIELYLCNAGVFNSCYVPMEGQCSVNIQISMFGMCTTVGKIVYSLTSIKSDIQSSFEEKDRNVLQNIRCNAYNFIHIYFSSYSAENNSILRNFIYISYISIILRIMLQRSDIAILCPMLFH